MKLTEIGDRLRRAKAFVEVEQHGRFVRIPFADLADDVDQMVSRLSRAGLKTNDRLGLYGANGYRWLVADLACLAMGLVNVALSPSAIASHRGLRELADALALSVLLTDDAEAIEGASWIGDLDGDLDGLVPRSPSIAAECALPTDVFALTFSSGTTGAPKCLMVSRRGVELEIESLQRLYPAQRGDKILCYLPMSGFQQRLMVYLAIAEGFDVAIARDDQLFRVLPTVRPTILIGPPLLFELVENRFRRLSRSKRALLRIADAFARSMPTAGSERFLRERAFRDFHRAFGGRVRLMLVGSAPSRHSTLRLFETVGLPLYEVYGMTEVGMIAMNTPGQNRLGSVGRCLPADRSRSRPSVSLGPDGEVMVSFRFPQTLGYVISDGSLEFHEVDVPTGDLGRLDEDGYLYLSGRKKNLLLAPGGEKLQPEPFEARLADLDGVESAILLDGISGGGLICALWQASDLDENGEPEVAAAVRAMCDALPSAFGRLVVHTMSEPPTVENGMLTSSQKIDREGVRRHIIGTRG